MPETKRIMITLPKNLLEEVDCIVNCEKGSRSYFFRKAVELYLAERKKLFLREQLKQGYMEMAQLNLRLALEDIAADAEIDWSWAKKAAE